MKCPNCGFINRADAHFCQHCGQVLPGTPSKTTPPPESTCLACGLRVKPDAHYCPHCGQTLPAAPSPAAQPGEITCSYCGTTVKPQAHFCPHCGRPLPTPGGSAPSTQSGVAQPVVPVTPPPPLPPSPPSQPKRGGQIIFGDKNIQIGSIHGSQVNIFAGPPPQAKSLARPVSIRPPAINLLNRKTEVTDASKALSAFQSVEFHGKPGLGKTALLQNLAHHSLTAGFADGVIYHSLLHQSAADSLLRLYDYFYQRDHGFIPTDGEVRRVFQTIHALIILDDVALDRDEMKTLVNSAPKCTFLMASSKHRLWGQQRVITLSGLPPDAALALVEQELGRQLTPQERSEAQQLCKNLQGHPLNLRRAAARLRDENLSPAEVLRQIEKAPSPSQALTTHLLASLTETSQRLVAVLAALPGATLPADHLAALASLPDATPGLKSLLRQGLVQAHSPRYSLTGDLDQVLQQTWNLTPWAERSLTYFTAWAEGPQSTPDHLVEEIGPILQTLEWAVGTGRWAEVLRLCRAVESDLALSGRWGAWDQVLQWALQAARHLGEQAAEAWVLHELGTRALCLGDATAARSYLNQALQLRQALGDRAGAAVTQHNLNQLQLSPPAPQRPIQPAKRVASRSPLSTWGIPVLALTALTITLVLFGLVLATGGLEQWFSISTPLPTIIANLPTATATAAQTPLSTPSPTKTTVLTETPTPVLSTSTPIPPRPTSTLMPPTLTPMPTTPVPPTSTPVPPTPTLVPITPTPVPPTPTPFISFVAIPETIELAQCATLQWQIENVKAAFLNGGGFNNQGVAGPAGSQQVCPSTNTTYSLRVVLPNDVEKRYEVVITVILPPTLPPRPPDLVVTTLETTGSANITSSGDIELPIRVIVTNQGDIAADIFKVSIEYTGPRGGPFVCPFTVQGQRDLVYPFTSTPLVGGDSVAFAGIVTFSASEQGQNISLQATADSCSGEEFMPNYCRVQESNENNNKSTSLSLTLPAWVIE